MIPRLKDAFAVALVAAFCFWPLLAIQMPDNSAAPLQFRLAPWAMLVLFVFAGRLLWQGWHSRPSINIKAPQFLNHRLPLIIICAALALPFFVEGYVLDVAIMVGIYVLLAYALSITVGQAGMLDLGFVAYYAIGAYGYGLLAQFFGLGFWLALPLLMGLAAIVALIIGFPVLRLRGDYLAIVTLGFAEIVRLLLINLTSITGGPNGLSGIPRPSLFGLEFGRTASDGGMTFAQFMGWDFSTLHRTIFLYFIVLALVVLVYVFLQRLSRLPLGRAFEALREDEIAATALGLNATRLRLTAYALAGAIGALAGVFFAARQGFVSPESFTFMESATILAIVVLGGLNNLLGIAFAALLIIGIPELFRDFADYRMLAFGLAMVLIMLWRPHGLVANRTPKVSI